MPNESACSTPFAARTMRAISAFGDAALRHKRGAYPERAHRGGTPHCGGLFVNAMAPSLPAARAPRPHSPSCGFIRTRGTDLALDGFHQRRRIVDLSSFDDDARIAHVPDVVERIAAHDHEVGPFSRLN